MADYTMKRGTTFVLQSTFYRGVDKNNNKMPMDLTGAVVVNTAKKNLNDADGAAVWQIKSPVDIAIVGDPKNGTVIIRGPAAATIALPAAMETKLYFDTKVFEADGTESIPEAGIITVQPATTQAITPPP